MDTITDENNEFISTENRFGTKKNLMFLLGFTSGCGLVFLLFFCSERCMGCLRLYLFTKYNMEQNAVIVHDSIVSIDGSVVNSLFISFLYF